MAYLLVRLLGKVLLLDTDSYHAIDSQLVADYDCSGTD